MDVMMDTERTLLMYTDTYNSPLGEILIAADEEGLTGLWFKDQKYFALTLKDPIEKKIPVIAETERWLDIYFTRKNPDFMPPLHPSGTPFQQQVWDLLLQIPYGETATYGQLAEKMAEEKGIKRMSAQAVGGAVGHNHISIIIPCHRVLGKDGSMTGYAGGIERKERLLLLEKKEKKL